MTATGSQNNSTEHLLQVQGPREEVLNRTGYSAVVPARAGETACRALFQAAFRAATTTCSGPPDKAAAGKIACPVCTPPRLGRLFRDRPYHSRSQRLIVSTMQEPI